MYTKIDSIFWKDKKMKKISHDARHLMLYLLTTPHRNILGCYYLPSLYACCDLDWKEERFFKALEELTSINRVGYDNEVILIYNYLKHNPLENPNQVKSAITKLDELPETSLFKDLLSVLERFNKPFIKPLVQRLTKRLGKPVAVTVEVEVPVTVTEKNNGGLSNREVGEKEEPVSQGKETTTTDNEGAVKKIVKGLQDTGILIPSKTEVDEILAWYDEGMEVDVILFAMKKAAMAGVRKVNYIRNILKGFHDQGITTLVQAEAAEQEFEQRKNRQSPRGQPSNKKSKKKRDFSGCIA